MAVWQYVNLWRLAHNQLYWPFLSFPPYLFMEIIMATNELWEDGGCFRESAFTYLPFVSTISQGTHEHFPGHFWFLLAETVLGNPPHPSPMSSFPLFWKLSLHVASVAWNQMATVMFHLQIWQKKNVPKWLNTVTLHGLPSKCFLLIQ
jgi:hypothetical protein